MVPVIGSEHPTTDACTLTVNECKVSGSCASNQRGGEIERYYQKKRGNALRLPSWVQTSPRRAPSLAEKGVKKSRLEPIGLCQRSGQCLFTTVPERRNENPRLYFSPRPLSRSVRYDTNAAGDVSALQITAVSRVSLYSNAL